MEFKNDMTSFQEERNPAVRIMLHVSLAQADGLCITREVKGSIRNNRLSHELPVVYRDQAYRVTVFEVSGVTVNLI